MWHGTYVLGMVITTYAYIGTTLGVLSRCSCLRNLSALYQICVNLLCVRKGIEWTIEHMYYALPTTSSCDLIMF